MENYSEKDDLRNSLIESENQIKTVQHNCCYYFFCCHILSSSQKLYTKNYYIENWRKYLAKEASSKKEFDDPFKILTNLWAHKDVINDLESIRLNPNISGQLRNDLEFYIPQLCTFLIFGEYEVVEEFLSFLCKACYASFFFAHRILWFLKSLSDENTKYNQKIQDILQIVQTIYKSEFDKKYLVSFHIANSEKLVKVLQENDSYFLYTPEKFESRERLSYEKVSCLESKEFGRNVINDFSETHYNHVIKRENNENEKDFTWDNKLGLQNIFLDIFQKQEVEEITSLKLENFNSIDLEDSNLTSFLSTIHFYDNLCNICEIMRVAPEDKQLQILQKELFKINTMLPSNIYIPFLSDAIRNYVIVHIPVSETKIFRTKNRAPYMITVEMIRIDELIYYYKSNYKDTVSSNYDNETNRSHSFIVPSKKNKTELNPSRKDEKKNNPKKSMSEYNISKRDEMKTINFLKEQDVLLSKPIIVRKQKERPNKKIENKLKDVKLKLDDFDENDLMKKRVTISYIHENPKRRSEVTDDLLSERYLVAHDKTSGINECKLEHASEIRLKNAMSETNPLTINSVKESTKGSYLDSEIKKTALEEVEGSNENIPTEIFYEEEKKQNDSIFGEKFDEQAKRLRKNSPFGNCYSWKLFKIIVKSGEDLRQEQFATQLINEFYQIFKLEKLDIWLKPYEILSTGSNVGIIECVPNAVSIDYLKRKAKNFTTLRQFFEQYYGGRDSERFEKAIDNFIKSVAGYSLVCYFLQIKDRHNGNILIDDEGHIIHIDFGFMLSNAPGKGLQFEKAPFKLTSEFVEVMGGLNSPNFSKFRKLIWKGFIAISKHHEKIAILVEMMYCGHGYNLPCFARGDSAIDELKRRFVPKSKMNKYDYISHSDQLIELSIDNWRTKWYDKFQYWMQGIFY